MAEQSVTIIIGRKKKQQQTNDVPVILVTLQNYCKILKTSVLYITLLIFIWTVVKRNPANHKPLCLLIQANVSLKQLKISWNEPSATQVGRDILVPNPLTSTFGRSSPLINKFLDRNEIQRHSWALLTRRNVQMNHSVAPALPAASSSRPNRANSWAKTAPGSHAKPRHSGRSSQPPNFKFAAIIETFTRQGGIIKNEGATWLGIPA